MSPYAHSPRSKASSLPAISVAGTALLAACLTASPAAAQAVETAEARAAVVSELTLEKEGDLDFGTIAGSAAGTIQMAAAASPACTASSGLAQSGQCQPARFVGRGTTGQIIRIRKPAADRISLTGPGEDLTITNLLLNGSPELTAVQLTPGYSRFRINSASGIFAFRLSGELNVGANQSAGLYTGTFDIDIDYD